MKQIIVNSEGLETRLAVVVDGKLEDYFVERTEDDRIVGSIFNGRIRNLEPSLQAAFVDIGTEKNAFLHYWDMLPATQELLEDGTTRDKGAPEPDDESEGEDETSDVGAPGLLAALCARFGRRKQEEKAPPPGRRRRPRQSKQRNQFTVEDIPELFKVNSDVLVQVTKGPIGTKGARVTTTLSVPGRYLVLLPNSGLVGVSKRIDDREERARLRHILRGLKIPDGMGVICRTVGAGVEEELFQKDLAMLLRNWKRAEKLIPSRPAPACVYEEPALLERVLRDVLTGDVDEIVTDRRETHDLAQEVVRQLSRRERVKVRRYDGSRPIFHKYGLGRQIESIFRRVVPLPGGGYVAVDETEALVAIDVNSGKNRAGKDHPETILNTNLEAAEEVARQLRLRNIGGLLVIDFIDMRSRADQQTVYKAFRTHLQHDKARTRVLPISQLGLVEMTRQRENESLQDTVSAACPYCDGRGRVKSPISVSVEIQRRLQSLLRRRRGRKKLRVTVHPSVMARLKNDDADRLRAIEEDLGADLTFRAEPSFHVEEYRLTDIATGDDL